MKYVKFFLMMATLCGTAAQGQDSLHVSRLAHLFDYWISPRGVAVVDTLVYVATNGTGLRVVSTADPDHPYETGYYDAPLESSQDVAVVGNYAYVVEWSGFRVIDIADPTAPTEAGYCPSGGFRITVAGNYAYVAGGSSHMSVVDISNPSAPVEIGSYDSCTVRDIEVRDSYAYVAGYGDGFRVFNVANPAFPVQVGILDTNLWNPGAVAVAGNYAFLACYTSGLRIVDISNPAAPVEVGSVPFGDFWDVAVAGNYVYLADLDDGIHVYDISNPAEPQFADHLDLPFGAGWLGLGGNFAATTDGYSLRIANITDPHNLVAEGTFEKRGQVYDVAAQGDYAYAANGAMQIIDVSQPASPIVVGTYDDFPISVVEVSGDHAYVGGFEIFEIVNISNPAAPYLEGMYPAVWEGEILDIAVSGDYAYLAVGEYGLQIYDVADSYNPYLIGTWQGNSLEPIAFVTVKGNYAYATDNQSYGLHVIDVSNPSSPVRVNNPSMSGGRAVDVVGNFAYVAAYGFFVLDVTDPANPVHVGDCATSGDLHDVKVLGNYAYVTTWSAGLRVIDISDPTNPVEVGFHLTPSPADKVAVSGCNAYLAEWDYFSTYDISYFAPCPVPRAPEDLVIQYVPSSSAVQLNWAPVLSDTSNNPIDVSRYTIYRSADEVQWDSIGVPTPPDTTVYIDATATGAKRFYQVRAVAE